MGRNSLLKERGQQEIKKKEKPKRWGSGRGVGEKKDKKKEVAKPCPGIHRGA